MNGLGRFARRIELEYLERLNKVRYGLDGDWRPPGLILSGGTAEERRRAMERLRELAIEDGFPCAILTLRAGMPITNYPALCGAILAALGQRLEDTEDPADALRRFAGRQGCIVLLNNVDRFEGSAEERAHAYRELTRWMGTLPNASVTGLFAVLAVTPAFEQSVSDASERAALEEAVDGDLLQEALVGLAALEHERTVHELLVLETA